MIWSPGVREADGVSILRLSAFGGGCLQRRAPRRRQLPADGDGVARGYGDGIRFWSFVECTADHHHDTAPNGRLLGLFIWEDLGPSVVLEFCLVSSVGSYELHPNNDSI
jgi:hypothetical protein